MFNSAQIQLCSGTLLTLYLKNWLAKADWAYCNRQNADQREACRRPRFNGAGNDPKTKSNYPCGN